MLSQRRMPLDSVQFCSSPLLALMVSSTMWIEGYSAKHLYESFTNDSKFLASTTQQHSAPPVDSPKDLPKCDPEVRGNMLFSHVKHSCLEEVSCRAICEGGEYVSNASSSPIGFHHCLRSCSLQCSGARER